jgi:hypothetical protein
MSAGLQAMPVLVDIQVKSFADLTTEALLNTFAAGEEVFAGGDHVQAPYLILGTAPMPICRTDPDSGERCTHSHGAISLGNLPVHPPTPSSVTNRP